MAYKNKIYICFDADNDIHYYRLMQAWKEKNKEIFNFYDAHDINNIMHYSNEDTIKRNLFERLKNSKLFLVLVGESTKYLYKYVRWEIQKAIDLDLPIIVVNLNKVNGIDENNCPPLLLKNLSLHVPFEKDKIKQAINIWTNEFKRLKNNNENSPRILINK